jgi:hypothetical protein
LITLNSFCQKGVIHGELIDFKTGQPIKGVPLILFGTSMGTVTDSIGKFELKNLRFGTIELIIHGRQYFESGKAISVENNYYSLILRNITLDKNNKTLDLGILYMLNKGTEQVKLELPCMYFSNKYYKYSFVDGTERHIEGKMSLLDFKEKYENCDSK